MLRHWVEAVDTQEILARRDTSPLILDIPSALVKASHELYSSITPDCDLIIVGTSNALSDYDQNKMTLRSIESVFATFN